jgi:hypothetical protein
MTHTKWLDHCCRTLEHEQECPTDALAVGLVKARGIVQRIGERFSYDEVGRIQSQSDTLIEMALSGFKNELSQLASSPAFSTEAYNGILPIEYLDGTC